MNKSIDSKGSNNRIHWIDMAKGYGIILVILGHIPLAGKLWELNSIIYSFHIPLFFFLSGYVFTIKENKYLDFQKHKIKTIIKPYFGLGLILISYTFVSMYFVLKITNKSEYINIITSFVLQKRMWTLWFLTCLFLINISYYFFKQHVKNYIHLGIIVLIICILGIIYYKFNGKALIWNIDICLTAFPFFFLGNIFREMKIVEIAMISLKTTKKLLYIFIFITINLMFYYLNIGLKGQSFEMYLGYYGFPALTYISAFAGIFSIILFSNLFYFRFIEFIGKNSIIYFGLYQSLVYAIIIEIFNHFNILQNGHIYIKTFSFFILIILVNTLIVILINKTSLRKIIL
jgi:fucose 4-O-acetylase-like acetyltransferase